jgi:hypothetical protein
VAGAKGKFILMTSFVIADTQNGQTSKASSSVSRTPTALRSSQFEYRW